MTNLIIFVSLLILGYLFGTHREKSHYESIRKREEGSLNVPITTTKSGLPEGTLVESIKLASGSVVISVDYFKRFLTGIRVIFGGEVRSYASLVDRGRREAILRMKEAVPEADLFLNCRVETASISKGQGDSVGSIEFVAYATAVRYKR